MSFIKTFAKGTQEYKNLEAAAALMTAFSPKGIIYRVQETYFDYGQDWMWTTIIAYEDSPRWGRDSWQALNPREQEEICLTSNVKELAKVVEKVMEDNTLDKE